MKIPSASSIEHLPWPIRTLLGCGTAVVSVGLTYAIAPLHAFPLLLAFPTVVLSAWFFGMAGSFGCAVLDVTLVDLLLTKTQFRFSTGFAQEEVRLSLFLVLSTLLGVLIRHWADQRTELNARELKKSLILAQAQKQMAEERARAGEALRDRDAALQIALRASGMGLWSWDVASESVQWSDEMFRILGYEPGQFEPRNKIWFDAIHPDDAETMREGLAHDLEHADEFRRQYRVVWPDGTVRWVEAQGQCVRGKDGRATLLMGVVIDVTHRKRAEEAMLRAEKLAVAGRLAASVAHEINNPLAGILTYARLLEKRLAPEKPVAEWIKTIQLESKRCGEIVNNLLVFARKQHTEMAPADVKTMVQRTIAVVHHKLEMQSIKLEVEIGELPSVFCDASQIQQVMLAIIMNAVDAMTAGGGNPGRLRVRAAAVGEGRIDIAITNNGPPILKEVLPHIFEPFFSTKKAASGVGLGLAVAYGIVKRHGGDIQVDTEEETTFHVLLPVEQETPAQGMEDNDARREILHLDRRR